MASTIALVGLWATLCVRDPNYPGCTLRPGQCAELNGAEVCGVSPPVLPPREKN